MSNSANHFITALEVGGPERGALRETANGTQLPTMLAPLLTSLVSVHLGFAASPR